ncbi:hypothetical protein [Botrimarina hoheduenensis]|uniref:Uncharacterized protein n=1 Tax=Botrimarina hoheduenensis TaxID=2528000 RepID=A0A5C5VYU8_9BACT|nr:hypothetical protein [Botrimarina hoheduenensis]TWT43277.1 hypothetical protein Pla111_22270 [Botrimarina hoheduenensis]
MRGLIYGTFMLALAASANVWAQPGLFPTANRVPRAIVGTDFPALGPAVPALSPAVPVRESEAAVQAMPLLERPNRIGHFYGNTLRRAHYDRLCVNCGKEDRPLARYFYRP